MVNSVNDGWWWLNFFGGLLWGVQQPPQKWRIQSNSFRFPTFCSFHWYEIGNGWKLDAAKLLNDQNKGFSAVNRRSAPRYFLICGLAQVKCLSQWSPCKSCFLKMYRPHSSFSWLHPIQLSVAIWSALRQCLSLSFSVGWSGFTQCSLMKRVPGDCFEHFPLVCSGAEFSQLENFRFLIFTCDLGPT